MIPIQMNNSFAEEHYERIKMSLLHHIERVLDDGGIKKTPRGNDNYLIEYSESLEEDLETFISDPENNLKPIIVLKPDELENKVNFLIANKSDYVNKWHDDNIILHNIFVKSVYENEGFDKWEFIHRINIDTCSYCNRNYIFTTKKNKKIKPEIDHFYPKSIYPILGLSYYNLIPSCKSCNGFGAKEEKDPLKVGLKNPYLINSNDFELSHKIKSISIINPLSGKSDVEVFFKKSIPGHLDVFNLKDLYELHHDHAIELVIKRNLKYSKKYRDYLKSYSKLKFSDSEIDRMILGNYALEKEQHKRPLSKMYQDIGRELGLIK